MQVETIASALTQGRTFEKSVAPEGTSDEEYIELASQTTRREAARLLRLQGAVRTWNPKWQIVCFVGVPLALGEKIAPFNTANLSTTVANNGFESTISLSTMSFRRASDPERADEIRFQVAGVSPILCLPKTGVGLFRQEGFYGVESDQKLTRDEIDAYNDILGVLNDCFYPSPNASPSLVCVDKTNRKGRLPFYDSTPTLQLR